MRALGRRFPTPARGNRRASFLLSLLFGSFCCLLHVLLERAPGNCCRSIAVSHIVPEGADVAHRQFYFAVIANGLHGSAKFVKRELLAISVLTRPNEGILNGLCLLLDFKVILNACYNVAYGGDIFGANRWR